MRQAEVLADYLRCQATCRGYVAEQTDDDRHTRSGMALLDAAEHIEQLPEEDSRLVRLASAGYFDGCTELKPGEHGQEVIGSWNYQVWGTPEEFLNFLVEAADADGRNGDQPGSSETA